ncbi:JAB-like toxin 1 domain-containing protein [uncultured Coprobacter sp.]|nr:JAB-like toxin 1 domain-containing protein [uncultured Coprobacter sp.]
MDIWEINNEGRIINRIKDRTQDAFFMVALNENGEYQRTFTIDKEGNKQYNNIIFNYGTIESQNSISYYNQKQNKKDTYDEYKIRGDTNGKSLFEFLSFNVTGSSSQVEIGLAQTGIPGNKGLNFITTGHIKGKEPGGSYLMSGRLYYNYTIRSIIHSHPISKYASPNDIGFKDEVNRVLQQYQLPIPQYQIFHVPSKRYINF